MDILWILLLLGNQCGVLGGGNIKVVDPLISHHCALFMSLLWHKPQLQRKTICYRKLCSIDCEEFNITFGNSTIFDEACTNLDSLVDSVF